MSAEVSQYKIDDVILHIPSGSIGKVWRVRADIVDCKYMGGGSSSARLDGTDIYSGKHQVIRKLTKLEKAIR